VDHITQGKRKLKALILERFENKAAQADADANDGVTTPFPAKIYTTEKMSVDDYPAIEMVPDESNPQGESLVEMYRHRIVVGFTLVGDDEETLTTQVERYMWVLRHLMRDTHVIPDPIGPVDTGTEKYELMQQTPPGMEIPFVKGGVIEVFYTTIEDP
jgi:hypothetical protein